MPSNLTCWLVIAAITPFAGLAWMVIVGLGVPAVLFCGWLNTMIHGRTECY